MTNKPAYENPTASPRESEYWLHLSHDEPNDRLIHNLDELKSVFRRDVLRRNDPPNSGDRKKDTAANRVEEDQGGPLSLPMSSSATSVTANKSTDTNIQERRALAVWSALLGYMEAISTNKQPNKRYNIYPIPYDAIIRLVQNEFLDPLVNNITDSNLKEQQQQQNQQKKSHRDAAKEVSNYIFANIPSKSNVRDEKHANSLYIVLRGRTLQKSIDCFGAALSTVIGLRYLGYDSSVLTLSEDHAYESHALDNDKDENKEEEEEERKKGMATCEVAIPGNTISSRSKRGQSIYKTFSNDKGNNKRKTSTTLSSRLTPGTSWLYMNNSPVYCDSTPKIIAACLANVNCSIDENYTQNNDNNNLHGSTMETNSKNCTNFKNDEEQKQYHLFSGSLYDIKRDLLWILHDEGYISDFPFALCELGDCEEHRTSSRGESWSKMNESSSSSSSLPKRTDKVENAASPLPKTTSDVLAIEALYDKAIRASRDLYNDGQVYPYCYAGHYHKDAGLSLDRSTSQGGEDGDCSIEEENEYRLSLAVQFYAEASRVASGYIYEWGDSLQLTKVMAKLAEYILNEIVTVTAVDKEENTTSRKQKHIRRVARSWQDRNNAISAGTWIAAFYDSLLFWEEETGSKFLPMLNVGDSRSLGKIFSYFSVDDRREIVDKLTSVSLPVTVEAGKHDTPSPSKTLSSSSLSSLQLSALQYFTSLRSKRMGPTGMILKALRKEKVLIGDMELAIVIESNDGGRRSRRARTKR